MKKSSFHANVLPVALCTALAVLMTGCAETVRNPAWERLTSRGIQFTPEAFLSAAEAGRADEVQLFLDGGMDPHVQDQYGAKALSKAAQQGHADVVRVLIQARANVNYQPRTGDAALIEAAQFNRVEVIKALIEAGADLNVVSNSNLGGMALSRAASLGHWEIVGVLLEAGADPNASGSAWPALALAAEKNQVELVELLLEKGADPNYRFPGGAAVLWQPVWQGQTQVVRLLLEAGARVSAAERKFLLKGPDGKPVKPEIRKLLLNPPKPKRLAQAVAKQQTAAKPPGAHESAQATLPKETSGAGTAQLGQAVGTLVINKQEASLTHSYAFFEETDGKLAKKNVVILLTNMPLPQEAIREWREKSLLAYAGKLQAVELTISPEQEVISGQFWHKDKSFSATGMHVFEPATFDGKTVAGRLSIPSEHEFFNTTYQYRATFAARIIRPEKPVRASSAAESSAAEQSVQGHLYRTYLKALREGDMTTLKGGMTKEQVQAIESKSQDIELAAALDLMRAFQPQEVTLVKLQETGDKAELFVTGRRESGAVGMGTVSFVKEGGEWRILTDSWNWKSK